MHARKLLALRTLLSFDFEGLNMTKFVFDNLVPLIKSSSNDEIRKVFTEN